MVKDIEILKGASHIHNSILIERVSEEDYIIDEKFPCKKEHVIKTINHMSDVLKFRGTYIRHLSIILSLEYGEIEEREFMRKLTKEQYNFSQCIMFGDEFADGKIFAADLPIFIYEGKAKYIPLTLSDEYLCGTYELERYVAYLAKTYFWNHLADKNIWEKSEIGGFQKKKRTFYERDSTSKIKPVIVDCELDDYFENIFQIMQENKDDKYLLEANEFALACNKRMSC